VILSRTSLTTTSKEVENNTKITLAPNPARENISLLNLAVGSSYQILDMYGRVVREGIYNGTAINIEDLKTAMYLLQASGQTLKVLIE
jgi:hypothetical protein